MSFSGKFIGLNPVIEKVYRDSGLDYVDFENAIEWAVELIGLIGIPAVYVDKTTNGMDGMPSALSVTNYRCQMPDDCEKIISVRKAVTDDNDSVIGSSEMIESLNIFHPIHHRNYPESSGIIWNPLVKVDTFDPQTEDFTYSKEEMEIEEQYDRIGVPYMYKIDQGYIFTNFESGYIVLSYKGLPIDADGFPMVPDDAKFIEALKWHIINKIDNRNYRLNPSPQNKSIENDSATERAFYVAAARNKSHIPSIDKMEAIKNMWLRSIPKINQHNDGFATLNVQEQRYTQRFKPSRYRRNV